MSDPPKTFSESWYRIAAQRVALRPHVKVQRQFFRGERWYVLSDPFNNQFYRLTPAAYDFVARLRPDRTVSEAWQESLEYNPDEAPGQEEAVQLLAQLYHANLLQSDLAPDSAQLFERYKKRRQREARAKWLSIMFARFPLLDPDLFLKRALPLARLLISPFGAIIWVGVVGLAVKVAVDHWPALLEQSQGILAPGNLLLLYLGFAILKALHEFGHAFVCKRFGGEVHTMGVMLLIFTPVPYVDTTSSWAFRSRWQRALVGASGMIVELFVAALAVFVWAYTGPGTLHSLAYNMMFTASVSTILFNANPLMRFDGYYILSDLLDVPNLSGRSMQLLKHFAEYYGFGYKKFKSPARNRSEAFWLSLFGVTSGIYRVFVFGGVLLFVADRYLLLGILMAVVCLIGWVIVPLGRFIKYLGTSPKLERTRPRAVALVAGVTVAVFAFLYLVPFPNHFKAPGVLKAVEHTVVVNETAGVVEKIIVPSGSEVVQGQPLLQLCEKGLDFEIAAARAKLEESQARLQRAMQGNTAVVAPLNSRREALEKRLRHLESQRAALTVVANQRGTWVAPELDELLGTWVARGTPLGQIINRATFHFSATVSQRDASRLFANEIRRAEVRLLCNVAAVLPVTEQKIIPAERETLPSAALGWRAGGEVAVAQSDPTGKRAAESFFEVRATVRPVDHATLLHGCAGRIRFTLPPEPLLKQWLRKLWQMLQTRYQV